MVNRVSGALALRAMRSAFLTRSLFGLGVVPLPKGDRYFDSATLALRHTLRQGDWQVQRVLEIGTGGNALLARWMSERMGWEVAATELDRAVAERARNCVRQLASGPVEVHQGSFFADVQEPLDLVVFNPPFVPSSTAAERGLPKALRTQWDGGPDGTVVLTNFLAAYSARATQAEALLAVNLKHVSAALVEQRLVRFPNLRLMGWYAPPRTPAQVAHIARAPEPHSGTPSAAEKILGGQEPRN